ncbi:hypothetical protein QYE76_000821 [Lolium multiflorum]|uniref:Protein kinase domain-containing protein n=1 Tax=Lolium multiflorum TaxID=4521 RepID=A0AAD8VZ35_LOLMU|nr:hypothetical protein QYE76_000821 [Lolium multiflorum]
MDNNDANRGLVWADGNVDDGPHRCGGVDIPYPFGIADDKGADDFRKGFDLRCTEAGQAVLATGGDGISIPFSNFSIRTAEVRAWLPVGWQCYGSSGKVVDEHYMTLSFNKEGVYRISHERNDLVVLGCSTLGFLRSKPQDSGDATTYAELTGCLCFCNDSKSAVDGVCSGVGCCHVDIPPNLVDNSVGLTSMNNGADMNKVSTCDYAFLAEKGNYSFHTADLNMDLRRKPRLMPVILDWAIRDSPTCKQARKKEGYACRSSNSLCVNTTNGPGYICKCRKGYEGNPYTPHGCTDINECERLGHHYHCKGECKNKQGYYECTCPKGTHSADPYNESCSPKFSTEAKSLVGAIGGLFIAAIMLFFWLLIKERRKAREHFLKNGGPALAKLNNIKLFTKEDLRKIRRTNNVIGSGGFGKVYKGRIEDINQLVAVKEPINGNSADKGQFVNEISIQSRVIHKNIVKLIGCCLEVDVPILVYEFVPNGSLHDILHGSRKVPLNMGRRLQIAAESAEGLAYMHSKTNTVILHGDVKPANILLNDEFMPKISDFGISRLIAPDKQHTGNVIGDMKYMDPVFLQTGLLTNKSDVYSFGVVLLELITRKKASRSDNNNLLKNFLEAYEKDKTVIELVDNELAEVDRMIIDNLARMIMQCLNLDVNQRPEMIDVAELLRDMAKRYRSK